MKFFLRPAALVCFLMLLVTGCAPCYAQTTSLHSEFVYGQSEMGRDLICHRVGRADASQSILIVFGIHGFEDGFDHDGEVLKKIAESLIAHYRVNAEQLHDFCLYIIPSANPDGLMDGTTNHGFGRCNVNGIDVNRDFSVDWSYDDSTRNQTGDDPFSTAEARAIRDLVEKVTPTYGIDVHGWKKAAYGNGKMAETFAKPFRFKVKRLATDGMLCAWLHIHTEEGILIELPYPPDLDGYVTENTSKMIQGIDAWIDQCSPGEQTANTLLKQEGVSGRRKSSPAAIFSAERSTVCLLRLRLAGRQTA